MSKAKLRPYQKKMLNDIERRFDEGADTVMMQLDTGAGNLETLRHIC